MSELITMEFARRDDCLDKMVPSDLRQLVGEKDALLARVARFEQAACDLNCHIAKFTITMRHESGAKVEGVDIDDIVIPCDALEAVANETPQQSLAEIEAAAVHSFLEKHGTRTGDIIEINIIDLPHGRYALRQQGGE